MNQSSVVSSVLRQHEVAGEQTYQQRAVTDSLLALSYWNFHKVRRVPCWSLNSSEASSKYLKSKKARKVRKGNTRILDWKTGLYTTALFFNFDIFK